MPRLRSFFAIFAALLASVLIRAQGTPPAAPLVLLTGEGRRPIPTTLQSGQELIALDDVAALFQVTVREDTLAGGVTVSYKGRTIVASPDQPMASVDGRLVALPAPAIRVGRRWLVPVEFLSRALGPIYDAPIELRKASRLLIVGDLRVPRVTTRIESAGPPTRLVVDIAPPAVATVEHEGSRLIVHIEADAIDPMLPSSGAGLVEEIRMRDQSTTLVAQLKAGTATTSTISTPSVTRLVIEIFPPGAPPTPAPAPAPDPADPLPLLTSPRAVLQTIVVDPGHGGEDGGAAGEGVLEKTLALEVARRVKTLVETRLGIRVLLTREDDRAVGLDERAAVANNSKADLFVSLHANGAFVPSVSGAEVFYLSLDPDVEEARRRARADSTRLPVLGGGTRAIDVIRWDLAQARHIDTSAVLAEILEDELRARVPVGPRSIQRAPLRVLVGANMPAVLVEVAYLTNPAQARQAASAEFQTSVTQAIYETVLRFRAYLEGRR